MLFISLLVYVPIGIYCSSVPEDSSTPLTHPSNSIKGYPVTTSTLIVPPIHTGAVAEKPRKKLPAGNDFGDMITMNRIYVDKTDIIYEMIENEKYVFLSRPPRFGKSLLLMSTLKYLFEGGPSNVKLFEGLSHFEGYRFSLYDAKMYNSLDVIDFLGQIEATDISSYHAKTDSKYVVEVIRNVPQIILALDLLGTLKTEDDTIPVDVGFIRGFKDSFPAPKAALKVLYEGGYLSVKKHESVGLSEPEKYYIGFTNKVAQQNYHEILKTAITEQE